MKKPISAIVPVLVSLAVCSQQADPSDIPPYGWHGNVHKLQETGKIDPEIIFKLRGFF
jgi:hypothetical protein